MKKTKAKATKTKKTTVSGGYNLVMYVANCTPKIKKFADLKKANAFVKKFQKQYPDSLAMDTGYWIDYMVQDVHGEVVFLADLDSILETS